MLSLMTLRNRIRIHPVGGFMRHEPFSMNHRQYQSWQMNPVRKCPCCGNIVGQWSKEMLTMIPHGHRRIDKADPVKWNRWTFVKVLTIWSLPFTMEFIDLLWYFVVCW